MNRRQLFQGAVAASIPFSAAADVAPSETQIMRLFRKQQAIIDAADSYAMENINVADDVMDQLFYREAEAIEAEMMAEPCTCAADLAAKMIVDTCRGGAYSDWETGAIWKEARALVHR